MPQKQKKEKKNHWNYYLFTYLIFILITAIFALKRGRNVQVKGKILTIVTDKTKIN